MASRSADAEGSEVAVAPKPVNKDDEFPLYQLTILAICRFSEPIAFNSILAYTYVMVIDLQDGDEHNASFYAGLLVSAYAVAEALTAMLWGSVSDKYGRKPVILFGLAGVAISSLIFGFAKSYWVALLARFVGGALNGNVSVMQTAVAETVKRPEHEPRAYASQPFVWVLGAIVGSAMGGFTAQPAVFYPEYFSKDGLFGQYPYLLPNLVSVVVIVFAIVQGAFLLEETNPLIAQRKAAATLASTDRSTENASTPDENSPLLGTSDQPKSVMDNLRQHVHEEGIFIEDNSLPIAVDPTIDICHTIIPSKTNPSQATSITATDTLPTTKQTFNYTVIMITVALVIIAFHQMAYCAILPIYLLDQPADPDSPLGAIDLTGGMGFTLHDVGTYLAVNGFIALFIQGVIFPLFVERIGVWHSFIISIAAYPLCYIPLPFLSMLREPNQIMDGITEQVQPWYLSGGIYSSMILQNIFGIISVPCAMILLKNATPSKLVLGRVNGLAMSAVCAARTISSPLVGVIYDDGGSAAAWIACAIIAMAGALELWFIPRRQAEGMKDEEEVVAPA